MNVSRQHNAPQLLVFIKDNLSEKLFLDIFEIATINQRHFYSV